VQRGAGAANWATQRVHKAPWQVPRQISQVPMHVRTHLPIQVPMPARAAAAQAAQGDANRPGFIGSIYWPAMDQDAASPTLDSPAPSKERPLDSRALAHLVARMNRASGPPWLHGEVARRMADRLAVIRLKPQQVLDWGAFVGGSRDSLARAYPAATIVAVELELARRDASASALRPPWWSPARWTAAPAQALMPAEVSAGSAQLLWSNMALHLHADPQALMARWHGALQSEGFLMFSTLGPGTLGSLRRLYERQGWPLPFAPFVDMHDLGDMLVRAGFADPVMDQETVTLTWGHGQASLDELRTLGGNVALGRGPGLRTPRWRQGLAALLEAECAQAGRVALPFEIVYGHAFKPVPRPRVAARTAIAVEDLRTMARTPRRPA
jgi:malonyl-CoA O-methyltransferase